MNDEEIALEGDIDQGQVIDQMVDLGEAEIEFCLDGSAQPCGGEMNMPQISITALSHADGMSDGFHNRDRYRLQRLSGAGEN